MFRTGVNYTPQTSSSGGSLGILAISLLFLLIVIVLFVLIFMRRRSEVKVIKTQEMEMRKQQIELSNIQKRMYAAGEEFGIEQEDLEQELYGSSNLTCLVYPENGRCDANFYDLKNGCCELKDNSKELARNERYNEIRKMLISIGYATIPELILQTILPKLTNSARFQRVYQALEIKTAAPGAQKAAQKAGQEAAEKVAREGGNEAAQQAARKSAEKTARKAFVREAGQKAGTKAAQEVAKKGGSQAAQKAAQRVAQRAAQKAAGKALSKAMAKAIAKTTKAMIVAMARRMAFLMLKILVKLSAGPVGWALLLFDVLVIIQDTADVYNYNSFIDNKINLSSRDQLIYAYNKVVKEDGGDFPVLFPFALLFPEESEEVSVQYMTHMLTEHMDVLLEVDGGIDWLVDSLLSGLEAEADGIEPPPSTLEEEEKADNISEIFFDKVREKHHRTLDQKYFELLQAAIPSERRNDIVLVQSMSTKETIGISISQEAANKWNAEQKGEWFQYLDPFFPPNRPSADWVPAMVATYTDTYLTPNMVNPGTQNQPNIVTKKLPEKVVLAYPFGPLLVFCEKPRSSMKYKEPVDPTKYGVSFDLKTGVCNYTRDYCQRYGIDFKRRTWRDGTPYNECDLDKTQEIFEYIFGQDNVRRTKLLFTDPEEAWKLSQKNVEDTWNKRREDHGTPTAVALTVVDPTGTFEGFGQNIAEQLGGRDKYCDPADTCKKFHGKHGGGNFMTMTARDKNGDVYSNGQGFQNQVKHGEDHTFFVPEGGYYKIDCNPGSSTTVPYDQITDVIRCSCWMGEAKCNYENQFWDDGFEALSTVIHTGVDVAGDVGTAAKGLVDIASDPEKVFTDPVGTASAVGGVTVTLVENAGGSLVEGAKDVGGSLASGAKDFGNKVASIFSDRRLKNNTRKMLVASPIPGLSLYTWEWNEIAMANYGLIGRDFGFIADEIDDQYISKDEYGYEFIREDSPIYQALMKLKSRQSLKT
jgi:putative hemolysin/uncharacterized membrane protein